MELLIPEGKPQTIEKFTVRFLNEKGEWEDVFPGLTGDYEWAVKVSGSTWDRNGVTITPERQRIYAVEAVNSTP